MVTYISVQIRFPMFKTNRGLIFSKLSVFRGPPCKLKTAISWWDDQYKNNNEVKIG